MNYQDSTDAFYASCQAYIHEKENLKQYKNVKDMDFLTKQMVQYIQEDVKYVESTFRALERKCGPEAKDIIYQMFVEGVTQTAVGKKYGLSRRQVQYAMDKWLKQVLKYSGE